MNAIQNAYWVIPQKVMAGPYPAARYNDAQTRQQLEWLINQGITHIIDLTSASESTPYENIFYQICIQHGFSGTWQRFAITDFGLPSQSMMIALLDQMDQVIAAGSVVYIHCQAGLGRTGTVVGCYLVHHGVSAEQALQKIQELRKQTPNAHFSSPESEAQRQFILNWKTNQ
jgi:protein-tyrosine phosphatase